jgi:signal transduction histidine kinase
MSHRRGSVTDRRRAMGASPRAHRVVAPASATTRPAAQGASSRVTQVHLDVRERTLRLQVRDDGIGGADPTRGSGIVALSDRVAGLGGTIAVASPPGDGTSMVVELPLDPMVIT